MFNVGAPELVLIGVVALLVLGPKRLPEMARGLGKALREFRRQTEDVRHAVEREFYRMDVPDIKPAEALVPYATEGVTSAEPVSAESTVPDQSSSTTKEG